MTHHRAIVLDEDCCTQKKVARLLAEEGFQVAQMSHAECVVEAVRREAISICILGGRIGGLDCLELARQLRRHAACGVIVMGRSDDEIDAVLALEMGADDYVPKPVRPRELAARVRSVLRRTAVTPPTDAGARPLPDRYLRRIDEIEISDVIRSVSVGGREVTLTPMEFDVLMVLAGKTNTVLSRAEVIRTMRGDHWVMNDRAVDSVISALRRKMFPDGSGLRRIRTIHGRGYMLMQSGGPSEE